jgi:hypothetical protein
LRIGLLDHDHALTFDDFCLHLLLLSRFQIAGALRFLAHALHGIHNVTLLSQECIA